MKTIKINSVPIIKQCAVGFNGGIIITDENDNKIDFNSCIINIYKDDIVTAILEVNVSELNIEGVVIK